MHRTRPFRANRRRLTLVAASAFAAMTAADALAFPAPVQTNPAAEMTAAVGVNYGQVQSFSRTLFFDENTFQQYPRLYWFKYTSDGQTRVKFDTLGSNIATGSGGVTLGSKNETQIGVYRTDGTKVAISKGTLDRAGNPMAQYPTYETTRNDTNFYYAQGLSELYLLPGATTNPHWAASPTDPNYFAGWSAPGNEGNSQKYYTPYYPTNLNEYQVWNTALSTVMLDNNGNPVINPNTGQPRAQPGWRYFDRARIGPGASWNQYGVLPAGDYYVAVTSALPILAGDTSSEEILRAPLHYDPDTGQINVAKLSGPLGAFQYYVDRNPSDYAGTIKFNVTTLPIADPTWQTNADGVWSSQANWSAALPTLPGAVAQFSSAITAPRTVTVDGDRTAGVLRFNSANRYTLGGTGTIRVEGWFNEALVSVIAGSHTISAPLLMASASSTFDVQQAGSTLTVTNLQTTDRPLTKSGAGRLELNTINAPALDIQAGAVRLTTTALAGKVASLSVTSSAALDLGSSALVLDYSATTSPRETIRGMLASARIATTTPGLVVGYGEASTLNKTSFLGQSGLDSTAILLRATKAGDCDLSGTVNFDDLLALAKNYNAPSGKTWTSGDIDYDGDVDFNDLLALAKSYNQSAPTAAGANIGTAQFQSDFALAMSIVPEPTSVVAIAGLVACIRRRR